MRGLYFHLLHFVLAGLIVSGAAAYAGIESATVRGDVRDTLGYPVPHAVVLLTQQNSRSSMSATSSSSGSFIMTRLEPGRYQLEAKMPGFTTFHKDDLTLIKGGTIVIHINLAIEELPSHLGGASKNFFFRMDRKAQSEVERDLISKAEVLPCPGGEWWKTTIENVRLPTCLNSEAISYFKALVEGYNAPHSGAQATSSEHGPQMLSAEGEYIATLTFHPELRQWVVELRLEYRHNCGNVCGLMLVKTREVVFDETKNAVKVIGDGESPHYAVS